MRLILIILITVTITIVIHILFFSGESYTYYDLGTLRRKETQKLFGVKISETISDNPSSIFIKKNGLALEEKWILTSSVLTGASTPVRYGKMYVNLKDGKIGLYIEKMNGDIKFNEEALLTGYFKKSVIDLDIMNQFLLLLRSKKYDELYDFQMMLLKKMNEAENFKPAR